MLIAGSYRQRQNISQAESRAGLERFTKWTPPAGFAFVGHWANSEGGGYFVAEAESGAAVFEATSAFADFLDFTLTPVIDIMESVPISFRVFEWLDSLK